MSPFPHQVVILGMLCCIFLQTNEVQARRGSSSKSSSRSSSSSSSVRTKVTTAKGEMQLVYPGDDRCKGQLHIKSGDSWHYVCHSSFTTQNAFVTCRDFNCGYPSKNFGMDIHAWRYDNEISLWRETFNCSGHEQRLLDCPVVPLQSQSDCEATFLECPEQPAGPEVRVYSLKGSKRAYGFVYEDHSYVVMCRVNTPFDVRSFVLQTYFGDDRQEWSQPAVDNRAYFFLPFKPSRLNNQFSFACKYNFESKPENFSEVEYGGVDFRESSYVRLVGEESLCMGELELEHEGEWRAVSQQLWGLQEAAVVCRQLQCGSVINTQKISTKTKAVWRFYSDCDGTEKALMSCGSLREGQSTSTVHVLCSDILHPANITAVSERNSSVLNTTVFYRHYSFSVVCSILPQFPGGHFSLVFTGVKQSLIQNQTAVSHSAVFTFDVAKKAHAGNYSCTYHNSVSGHNFSSKSPDISIDIEDAEDVRLVDEKAGNLDSSVCSGTLHVKDRSELMMVTAETLHWDMRHASIVCRQLGCGSALSTSKTEILNVTPMWRFFSDCDGSEAALLQCGHVEKWFSSKAIVVVCEG